GKFFCGAKSDTVVFDSDSVEIDFYFGHANSVIPSLNNPNPTYTHTPDWPVPEGYERVSIAAYFYRYGYNDSSFGEFADYRNIENFYFIKEFDPEEFLTEQYAATYTTSGILGLKRSTAFNHHETFTIPKEILIDRRNEPLYYNGADYFHFNLADIWFSEEKGSYLVLLGGSYAGVCFGYQYINDSQVKITTI
ncbi:MAG: hypothetical protein FWE85_01820, partial [Clostridiales bacterium]|nr:hypothetical protein [Clostridiales bacterium]